MYVITLCLIAKAIGPANIFGSFICCNSFLTLSLAQTSSPQIYLANRTEQIHPFSNHAFIFFMLLNICKFPHFTVISGIKFLDATCKRNSRSLHFFKAHEDWAFRVAACCQTCCFRWYMFKLLVLMKRSSVLGKISDPQVWFAYNLRLIPAESSPGLQI